MKMHSMNVAFYAGRYPRGLNLPSPLRIDIQMFLNGSFMAGGADMWSQSQGAPPRLVEKNPLNDLHQINNSLNVLLERIAPPKSNMAEVSYTSNFQSHPEKYTFDWRFIQDITEKNT